MKWVQHAARFPIRQYRLQYQACLTRVSAAIFKAFGMRARVYTSPYVSMHVGMHAYAYVKVEYSGGVTQSVNEKKVWRDSGERKECCQQYLNIGAGTLTTRAHEYCRCSTVRIVDASVSMHST